MQTNQENVVKCATDEKEADAFWKQSKAAPERAMKRYRTKP